MPSKIIDKDKGYTALMKRLGADQPRVKVGVFGDAASAVKDEGGEAITIGALAEIFEFGLGNNPERSWLRGYVDENNSRISLMINRLAQQVYSGKLSPEAALRLLGAKLVGEIQQRISAGIAPENAESTVKRKGSSVPLIDTGQFRGSITNEVIPAGVAE